MEIFIYLLLAEYGITFTFFTFSLLFLKDRRIKRTEYPGFSVIVPLHNEEDHIRGTIKALQAQNYPGLWEVIFVNDRSTDSTPEVISELIKNTPNFRQIHIDKDEPKIPSPKKRAMERGFEQAQYEILMSLDADCIPEPNWLTSMSENFHGNIQMVQGPKRIIGTDSPIIGFQKLETLGFTLIEGAFFNMKKPYLASAPSLAYKKDLFYRCGGFGELHQYVSGDDDMLAQKMAKTGVDMCYNLDANAQVATSGVETWWGLLQQRARWSSNGFNYEHIWYRLFLAGLYSLFLWLLTGPVVLFFFPEYTGLYLMSWAVKLFFDLTFFVIGSYKLKSRHLLKYFLWTELIHIPLYVLSAPMGTLKLYRWK